MASCARASSSSRAASAASGGAGAAGPGFDEAVQRREGFAAREREPRALHREIAEKQPHRPRLRDLLDLVEIERGGGEVADAATERGAGEQAHWNKIIYSTGAKSLDRLL